MGLKVSLIVQDLSCLDFEKEECSLDLGRLLIIP